MPAAPRGEFVVAHRAHGAPEPRVGEAPDEIARQGEAGDGEREIGLARGEAGRSPDRTDPVRPVGEADRVDEDDGQDLLERDRHHREIVAAQAQRRDAKRCARCARERHARNEAEPKRQPIVGGAEAHGIGAEREERGLREIDLAAKPEHDRQAEDGDRVGRRLHEDIGDIAVRLDEGRKRDERDGGEAVDDLSGDGAAHVSHAFSATRSPKMPCGRTARKTMRTRKAKASLNGTEI